MRLVYNTDVAIFASSSFVLDGIGYKELMAMCLRYQEHLTECANIMGIEQARWLLVVILQLIKKKKDLYTLNFFFCNSLHSSGLYFTSWV